MNTAANALVEHDEHSVSRPRQDALSPQQVGELTPMQMAYQLIQNGADLGSVKEMLALSKELAADQAKRAFDAAVADAKAEIGPVHKNRKGHNDKKYADFAAYAAAVDPILAKHGLSYRFRTDQTDKITVTCRLAHKGGHAEENSLSGPSDSSGSKNAIQAIGSTLTYLQRYTLVQALGLAASEDDDGRAAGSVAGPITEEQAEFIRKLAEDNGRDLAGFCKYFKIEAVPDLPAKDFGRAITALSKKKEQANG